MYRFLLLLACHCLILGCCGSASVRLKLNANEYKLTQQKSIHYACGDIDYFIINAKKTFWWREPFLYDTGMYLTLFVKRQGERYDSIIIIHPIRLRCRAANRDVIYKFNKKAELFSGVFVNKENIDTDDTRARKIEVNVKDVKIEKVFSSKEFDDAIGGNISWIKKSGLYANDSPAQKLAR